MISSAGVDCFGQSMCCLCEHTSKANSQWVKVQRQGPKYNLVHRYVCMFVSLCVYIKQPLTAIGGGGGPIGVFALAMVQHSTFLCDIQYCDLRKPTQQRSARSLSHSLPLSSSLQLQPFVLATSSHFSLPSSRTFTPPCFFSYVDMENHLSVPSLTITVILSFFFCQRSLDEAAFSQFQIHSLYPSPRYVITIRISPFFKAMTKLLIIEGPLLL